MENHLLHKIGLPWQCQHQDWQRSFGDGFWILVSIELKTGKNIKKVSQYGGNNHYSYILLCTVTYVLHTLVPCWHFFYYYYSHVNPFFAASNASVSYAATAVYMNTCKSTLNLLFTDCAEQYKMNTNEFFWQEAAFRELLGTGLVRLFHQALLFSFLTFLLFHLLRLSFAPTHCPLVSEDEQSIKMDGFQPKCWEIKQRI